MHRLTPQESVRGSPVSGSELLQFIHLDAALSLFDRNKSGTHNTDLGGGIDLRQLRVLTRQP
jgi:hypothetical protein